MSEPNPIRHGNRFKDMTGQRFTRLLVIEYAGTRARKALWRCRCDCGETIVTIGRSLRNGDAKSCGCYAASKLGDHARTHGQTDSPTYRTWISIITRCTNPNDPCWLKYGARGISMCDRWRQSFEAFVADMGERPDGMTIERINNNGNYEPSNCRWATATEQARNRRGTRFITALGRTASLAEWGEITGLSRHTISKRLASGWTPDDAVTVQK